MEQEQYKLVFEGVADSSDETLRKIKGVFLADLEFGTEQILAILSNSPKTIKESSTSEDLKDAYNLLKSAGSKVSIVTASGKAINIEEELSSEIFLELEDNLDLQDLSFEKVAKEGIPSYELKEDASQSLELLLEEAATKLSDDASMQLCSSNAKPTYTLQLDENEIPEKEPIQSETPQAQKIEELNLSLDLADKSEFEDKLKPIQLLAALESEKNEPAKPKIVLDKELTIASEIEEPKVEPVKAESISLDLAPESAPEIKTESKDENASKIAEVKAETPVTTKKADVALPPAPPPLPKPMQEPVAPATHQGPPPDINIVPIRDRRKKNLPPGFDIAFAIIVGSILLFAANWFYFNAPPAIDAQEELKAQELASKLAHKKKVLEEQRQKEEALKRELELLNSQVQNFTGKLQINDSILELNMSFTGTKPEKAELKITSSEPPELTKQEIASGAKAPLWLKRVESAQFEFIQVSDSTFIGTASTKIYIEQQGISTRIIRKAYIEGQLEKDSDTLELTVSVLDGENKALQEPIWTLDSSGKEANFELQQIVTLEKLITEEAQAPQISPSLADQN